MLWRLLADSVVLIFNPDKLGYASDLTSTGKDPRHQLLVAGLADPAATSEAVRQADPDLVKHPASESHVDRSIGQALPFPDAIIKYDWWMALVAASCGVIYFNLESFVLYRQ